MEGAADMRAIGIPFAIGTAAGAILFPSSLSTGPFLFPAAIAFVLFILTLSPLLFFRGDSHPGIVITWAAISFCIAGLFCSVNQALTSGIQLPPNYLERISGKCLERLCRSIDSIPYQTPGTAPLIKALITGDRSGLSKETIELFRASGASHILALSGLHLGIIYLIVTRITAPVGNSPKARVARYSLTVGTAGFYSLMTGMAPSIVRAFLFILIGETGKLFGRKRDPSGILLAALTIQLAVKPEVISTTGFQLSYLAMVGICTIFPILDRIYPDSKGIWSRIDPFRKICSGASLSVSCQVFTAPLVWFRFHSFPRYFLITNLIALPLTSAVMVLSVTTIALSLMGMCPYFLINLDDRAVGLLVRCLEIISSM
ncbi:MAG: ComEC/Rec2 family competence protein [Bacteroidales bacterium]|nr:ComEC/Rec2 family competence protein [Bacteroidales bacterium]